MDEDKTMGFPDEESTDITEPDFQSIEDDWFSSRPGDMAVARQDSDGDEDGDEEDHNDAEPGTAAQEANHSFRLKYMGQEIDVSKEEMVKLAQKGKDYDRIRSRVEALSDTVQENSGYVSFLGELAAKSGQSVSDFIGKTRSAMMISPNDAPAGAAVPATSALGETGGAAERRNCEVTEFLAEYGHVNPRSIPGEVWDGVRNGKTLLAAYQSYENKILKAQIDAERKNQENRLKTASSRATSGTPRPRGEIEDDWFNND